jgi:hypothetical protein
MLSIEARVSLPKGASPLNQYRRYYSFSENDPDLVQAIYEKGGRPAKMWLSWDQMPIIVDGGCSVIRLRFRASTKKFENVSCG